MSVFTFVTILIVWTLVMAAAIVGIGKMLSDFKGARMEEEEEESRFDQELASVPFEDTSDGNKLARFKGDVFGEFGENYVDGYVEIFAKGDKDGTFVAIQNNRSPKQFFCDSMRFPNIVVERLLFNDGTIGILVKNCPDVAFAYGRFASPEEQLYTEEDAIKIGLVL